MPKAKGGSNAGKSEMSGKRKKSAFVSRSVGSAAAGPDGSRSPEASKPDDAPDAVPAPGLYVVATPIGNASDISLRALDILNRADVVACEDTRVTRKLLSYHGIAARNLIAYHEHNAREVRSRLMKNLKSGEIVAQVSDAGTPMINDPGYRLVEACREDGIAVHALPGASAVTTALVLAGLPTDRFMFCGYPPNKSGKRRTWLGGIGNVDATLVILESPARLAASLGDMADVFGPRAAAITREMTKKFEEVRRGRLDELHAHYAEAGPPKGEVTLVIGAPEQTGEPDAAAVDQRLREALRTESVREASARIAAETGLSKRDIYARALALKDGG